MDLVIANIPASIASCTAFSFSASVFNKSLRYSIAPEVPSDAAMYILLSCGSSYRLNRSESKLIIVPIMFALRSECNFLFVRDKTSRFLSAVIRLLYLLVSIQSSFSLLIFALTSFISSNSSCSMTFSIEEAIIFPSKSVGSSNKFIITFYKIAIINNKIKSIFYLYIIDPSKIL